jgi:hypothetical protein
MLLALRGERRGARGRGSNSSRSVTWVSWCSSCVFALSPGLTPGSTTVLLALHGGGEQQLRASAAVWLVLQLCVCFVTGLTERSNIVLLALRRANMPAGGGGSTNGSSRGTNSAACETGSSGKSLVLL